MIVCICGPHGCGKTTLINEFDTDTPTVKVINQDMSKKVLLNNPGASNQFLRHELYFQTMHELLKLPSEYLILVDRAPISLTIYDRSLKDLGIYDSATLKELVKDYKTKLEVYYKAMIMSSHKLKNVLMNVPLNIVRDNIKKRNRNKVLNEGDDDYLKAIQEEYKKEKFRFHCVLTPKTKAVSKKIHMYKECYDKLKVFIDECLNKPDDWHEHKRRKVTKEDLR